MKILLLSAYDALSHRYWRENLVEQFSAFEWTVLSLPARYFRYRVRSNPLSWFVNKKDILQADYDLVIATSMVDIATLRGLVPSLAATPLWLYCHENQFAYPAGAKNNNPAAHELEAKMVFLYGCLAADSISFNSCWNRDSALAGLGELLQRFPEKINASLLEAITHKADVLPVPLKPYLNGIELPNTATEAELKSTPLRLLWNHRWEYDKGPDRLLALVNALQASGVVCELNVVGQQFRQIPKAFALIEAVLDQSTTLQKGCWGYIDSAHDYQQLLQQCDVVISTALHDYQGIAVLEAVQAGCVPLLPNQLVYPEIFAQLYLYDVVVYDTAVDDKAGYDLTVDDKSAVHNESTMDDSATANNMCKLIEQWQQHGLPAVPNISQFEWHKQYDYYENRIQSLYQC